MGKIKGSDDHVNTNFLPLIILKSGLKVKEKKYSRKDFLKQVSSVSAGSLGIWLAGPTKFLSHNYLHKKKYFDKNETIKGLNIKSHYQLFDEDWYFNKGDVPGAEEISFDVSGWRKLDLPHDWSIEDLPKKKELPVLSISSGEWKFKKGDNLKWKSPTFDDQSWERVQLPGYWNRYSRQDQSDSYGWYRKEIEIPSDLHGKDFLLNLGKIADSDETFFNGVRIGGMGDFPPDYKSSFTPAGMIYHMLPRKRC